MTFAFGLDDESALAAALICNAESWTVTLLLDNDWRERVSLTFTLPEGESMFTLGRPSESKAHGQVDFAELLGLTNQVGTMALFDDENIVYGYGEGEVSSFHLQSGGLVAGSVLVFEGILKDENQYARYTRQEGVQLFRPWVGEVRIEFEGRCN